MKEQNLKRKKQIMKGNSGITLIALIITIIVLLIIAVVAVGAVQDSDIIAHAGNAATGYNQAKIDEDGTILGYETFIKDNLPKQTGENNLPELEPEQAVDITLSQIREGDVWQNVTQCCK